ncbi:MAG: hypothetical protein OQL20_06545, partial [Sedimenticola sp.]|nr:hypothetical protein [Sedimenticola sp.]
MDYVDHGWRLSIRSDYLTSPIQHDLSDCRFCAAESVGDESDNCQMDGVFPLVFDQFNGVGVVCHVGAHSQRLLLFDSVAPNPKRVLTGSYYLSLALTSGGFEVTYDQLNHQGEPYEQNEMF